MLPVAGRKGRRQRRLVVEEAAEVVHCVVGRLRRRPWYRRLCWSKDTEVKEATRGYKGSLGGRNPGMKRLHGLRSRQRTNAGGDRIVDGRLRFIYSFYTYQGRAPDGERHHRLRRCCDIGWPRHCHHPAVPTATDPLGRFPVCATPALCAGPSLVTPPSCM